MEPPQRFDDSRVQIQEAARVHRNVSHTQQSASWPQNGWSHGRREGQNQETRGEPFCRPASLGSICDSFLWQFATYTYLIADDDVNRANLFLQGPCAFDVSIVHYRSVTSNPQMLPVYSTFPFGIVSHLQLTILPYC